MSNDCNDDDDDEDWGDASNEFIQQARTMLEQFQYPTERLAWVTSMYSGFYRFLVESPLITTGSSQQQQQQHHLGTYHQHYRIDGELVAVGVVDLLPDGVSSVYAFYDPHFAHSIVPLGKLMILKEIEYTKSLNKPYYYLGYYIESCTKMRYKAEYQPSELLCPNHFRWVDAKVGRSKLKEDDPHHGCTLYTGPLDDDDNHNNNNHQTTPVNLVDRILAHIPLSVGVPSHVTLSMLHTNGQDVVRPHLEEFLDHVGPEIAQECIVKLV
jgi:arginine-tRNA-protein transferase